MNIQQIIREEVKAALHEEIIEIVDTIATGVSISAQKYDIIIGKNFLGNYHIGFVNRQGQTEFSVGLTDIEGVIDFLKNGARLMKAYERDSRQRR